MACRAPFDDHAGVKYAYFRRTLDATINQTSQGGPATADKTWTKLLPSIDLHYAIQPNWTAYAQFAKGFLAPNINVFFNTDPAKYDTVDPQQTTNYQIGTTWKSHDLVLSGDLYRVDNNNAVDHTKVQGNKVFFNSGTVRFQGAEAEGTYYVGGGFSVYANASYNEATIQSSGLQIAGIPKHTEALAFIYNQGPWYADVTTKFIGARNGDYNGSKAIYPFSAVALTNLDVNYTVQGQGGVLPKGAKIGVQVGNLFDKNTLFALAGYTANGNLPLFYNTAGRSVMLNFSYPFQ